MMVRTKRRVTQLKRRSRAPLLCAIVVIAASPVMHVRGQDLDKEMPPPAEGLWPSAKLTELLLIRWADQVSAEYELDEEQRAKLRKAFVDRWKPYFEEHRATIQPVVNEYLEMRLDLAPPDKGRASEWAERAKPVFIDMRDQITVGLDDIRPILTPAQLDRFNRRATQFAAAMTFAEMKLEAYRSGDFDPAELWDPPGRPRRHDSQQAGEGPAEPEDAIAANPPEEADQITLEIRGWERFVADFCETYGLDAGQRDAASSFLTELTGRALAHRDQRHEEIEELEQRIASFSGSDAEGEVLKQRLVELYGPIDEMFAELKRRVEGLPSRSQRAAVEASAKPKPTPAKPDQSSAPATPPPASPENR